MPTETEFDIDIKTYLNTQKKYIDNHLNEIFNNYEHFKAAPNLWDAVKYSLLNGGKRLRGILCIATYESLIEQTNNSKERFQDCLTVACSLEMIHAMSLIHDDLPSMDNDDLRRGKPSCHKAFGEATAILAGDALLSLAFQIITDLTKEITETQKLELISTLTKAFSFGLVPGQILDLACVNENCSLSVVQNISLLKTAALIKASIIAGALIALNDNKTKSNIILCLDSFGLKTGIAYQIIDDILDITSDTKTLGKTSGKDEKQKKATYPSVIGLNESKKMAEEQISQAFNEIKLLKINSHLLQALSNYILNRVN